MLSTLRSQVEALGGLTSGVPEGRLEERFTETSTALARLSQRMDSLAATVESAATSLGDKEHELAALNRHFTESSTRIESIVDDIRAALAFPELGSDSIEDLAARIERVETATRKATETNGRTAAELTSRIDVIDQRVAAVAAEVARAKTLWPVALRSLEARLDDAVHVAPAGRDRRRRHAPTTDGPDEPADDLLAGLRDSLQAMETVAAEMARASDTLSGPDDEPAPSEAQHPDDHAPVAAAGATVRPASHRRALSPRCCGPSTPCSSPSAATARGHGAHGLPRARRPRALRATAAASLTDDEVRHQDGVDELAAPLVVPLSVSLALEAERLVQAESRLVPGKDVQLELAHARRPRPGDGLLEQHRSDPLAAMALGDHQPEVGDVPARGVRIAREREPPDDAPAVLGHEHGRVRMALDRAQVPPLVRDGAPRPGAEDPAAVLAPDALGELDERVRVARRRSPDVVIRRRSRRRRAADLPPPGGRRPRRAPPPAHRRRRD